MSTSPDLTNSYTDSPKLHANIFVASFQLLFWVLIHPSAWGNYVSSINVAIPPAFYLLGIDAESRNNTLLRRLMISAIIILPISGGTISGVLLLFSGLPLQDIIWGVTFGTVAATVVALLTSISFNVASGIVIGIAGSGLMSIYAGLMQQPNISNYSALFFGVAMGITNGLAYSVAGRSYARRAVQSPWRQIGSIVVGVFSAIIIYGLVVLLTIKISEPAAFNFALAGLPNHSKTLVNRITVSAAFGLVIGLTFGISVFVRTKRKNVGLLLGTFMGILSAFTLGLSSMMTNTWGEVWWVAIAGGIWYASLLVFFFILAKFFTGSQSGMFAGALASAGGHTAFMVFVDKEATWLTLALVLGVTWLSLNYSVWLPILTYPFAAAWNLLLYRADERRSSDKPSLLRYHSAFWDEYQRLPFYGLDEHLALVLERNPKEGEQAMRYLATSSQRWAAQAAQIELDARRLSRCADVHAIGRVHRRLGTGELSGPASAVLRKFSRISQDTQAALQQENAYHQRLALRATTEALDAQLRELTRSDEPYAARFYPLADQWRRTISAHIQAIQAEIERRQTIDSPYIIGVPLTAQQEIFVGRADVTLRIEQLLRDERRLPLLLYGQRRMGKTSLLNNLGRILPSTIAPLFVDLQGPSTQAETHAGFLYNLSRDMIRSAQQTRQLSLPRLARQDLQVEAFTRFDEWLDAVEETLGKQGINTILLALDEFEALNAPMADGRFNEATILGMFRHIIQHRARFKILLTGSHSLSEYHRWASYLINVQLVHLSYLEKTETLQLVERPIKDFPLRYKAEAAQRVLTLTRGHPFLVQLLCNEIVALKNQQDPAIRRLARLSDVETAVPNTLERGSMFFGHLEHGQVDERGREILRFIAAKGEGVSVSRSTLDEALGNPPDLDNALTKLLRREMIETAGEGYRFQVELIRRWFV